MTLYQQIIELLNKSNNLTLKQKPLTFYIDDSCYITRDASAKYTVILNGVAVQDKLQKIELDHIYSQLTQKYTQQNVNKTPQKTR